MEPDQACRDLDRVSGFGFVREAVTEREPRPALLDWNPPQLLPSSPGSGRARARSWSSPSKSPAA